MVGRQKINVFIAKFTRGHQSLIRTSKPQHDIRANDTIRRQLLPNLYNQGQRVLKGLRYEHNHQTESPTHCSKVQVEPL